MRKDDLKYEYNKDGIDTIISENKDFFLAIREVRWKENSEFKLDIRRYRSTESGDQTLKGISMSDQEVDDVVSALVGEGYGDDTELANIILSNRHNLCKIIKDRDFSLINNDSRSLLLDRKHIEIEPESEDKSDDGYYDPRYLVS